MLYHLLGRLLSKSNHQIQVVRLQPGPQKALQVTHPQEEEKTVNNDVQARCGYCGLKFILNYNARYQYPLRCPHCNQADVEQLREIDADNRDPFGYNYKPPEKKR